MNKEQGVIPGLVVADSGPLLCAGALHGKTGLNMLYQRFRKHGIEIVCPGSVMGELRHRARMSGAHGAAAQKMVGRSTVVKLDTTAFTKDERQGIRDLLDEAIKKRARRLGHEPKLGGNDGEIDAILLALKHQVPLLCNERPASLVARNLGLTVAHFAHLLRAELADNNLLPVDVDNYLGQLPEDMDTGLKNPSGLRISQLARISGI